MKLSLPALAAASLLGIQCLAPAGPPAAGGGDLFQKARAAYHKGNLEEAKKGFEQLLKAKPDFELARIHLAQIAAAERELAKIPASLKVARSARIKRFTVDGETLQESLEMAAKELRRAGGGPEKWNVLAEGSLPNSAAGRTIRLDASGVTVDQLLDALAYAGKVQLTYTGRGFTVRDNADGLSIRKEWDAGNPKDPDMNAAARKIIFDRFSVADASLTDVLDYLSRRAATLSGGTVKPVFAIRHDLVPRSSVTLDLRNVSLHDAVRSVCLVADLEEKWFPWGAGIDNKQLTVAPAAQAETPGAPDGLKK